MISSVIATLSPNILTHPLSLSSTSLRKWPYTAYKSVVIGLSLMLASSLEFQIYQNACCFTGLSKTITESDSLSCGSLIWYELSPTESLIKAFLQLIELVIIQGLERVASHGNFSCHSLYFGVSYLWLHRQWQLQQSAAWESAKHTIGWQA